MNVLALNCGSSSVKFQIVTVRPDITDEPGELRRARGAIERIEDAPMLSLQLEGRAPQREAASASDYAATVRHAIEKIRSQGLAIDAVAHRVVHGGNRFTQPAVIDRAVVAAIEALEELAALHNAPSLAGIRAAQAVLGPDVPMVAVFDTAFHAGLPDHAARYAIPHLRVRRALGRAITSGRRLSEQPVSREVEAERDLAWGMMVDSLRGWRASCTQATLTSSAPPGARPRSSAARRWTQPRERSVAHRT